MKKKEPYNWKSYFGFNDEPERWKDEMQEREQRKAEGKENDDQNKDNAGR